LQAKRVPGEIFVSKTYTGYRQRDGCLVMVRESDGCEGRPLPPRNDLRDHSPTGFCWGYTGSGPSQLALALAADLLGNNQLALDHYDQLRPLVSGLPHQFWELTEEDLWRAFHSIIV
jgi:Family of unknown function (DUF6166)